MKFFIVVNWPFAACVPEELTEAEGQFTSPGYPGLYHKRENCTWHITVKSDSRVQLHLQINVMDYWIQLFNPEMECDVTDDIILVRITKQLYSPFCTFIFRKKEIHYLSSC